MAALSTFAIARAALDAAEIPCLLVGGLALGAHGYSRATNAADLLAPRAALKDSVWASLPDPAVRVEVRQGDPGDPLVGVVRLRRARAADTDVIVVGAWTDPFFRRGLGPIRIRGARVRVADPADLVLLKLYAGGPKDLGDVRGLLGVVPGLAESVVRRLSEAPELCRAAWGRVNATG